MNAIAEAATTPIARIETGAGLVPRAGAFYGHFESKEALLVEIARSSVSETPEGFGLDRLSGKRTSALLISVLGGWLHYLAMQSRGAQVEALRDTLLDEWATLCASILDAPNRKTQSIRGLARYRTD